MSNVIERTPSVIAFEINSIKEQTRTFVLQSSIEIGRRLVEAKALVAHGGWGDWLQEHVDYSQSTANNLMKIYNEYDANSQALGNLTYTQAVTLLGVPAEEREAFVEENKVDQLSTRELQQAVKEKQQAIKEKEKLEKELRAKEALIEKERAEKDKVAKRLAEMESKGKEKESMVKDLKKQLEDAKAVGNDKEAVRLQTALEKKESELHDSQQKIKELETQLKHKPIDVPAVVEVIPDEVQKELMELRKVQSEVEELRKKVIQQNNKPVVKFTYCFDSLVTGFNDILVALGEIEEQDVEEHKKYKIAVTGFLQEMMKSLEPEKK